MENLLDFINKLHEALLAIEDVEVLNGIMNYAFGGTAEFARLSELARDEIRNAQTWKAAAEMQAFVAGEKH